MKRKKKNKNVATFRFLLSLKKSYRTSVHYSFSMLIGLFGLQIIRYLYAFDHSLPDKLAVAVVETRMAVVDAVAVATTHRRPAVDVADDGDVVVDDVDIAVAAATVVGDVDGVVVDAVDAAVVDPRGMDRGQSLRVLVVVGPAYKYYKLLAKSLITYIPSWFFKCRYLWYLMKCLHCLMQTIQTLNSLNSWRIQ